MDQYEPEYASKAAQHPLVLHLDPLPLFRSNRVRRHAEQEESVASVKDDEVVGLCTVRIEKRPRTIWIDRVTSDRREISPVTDITVAASGRANGAARPISVEDVDANLGDRATYDVVHARPAKGIGAFEAGKATAAGMNVGDGRRGMDLSNLIQRCDHDCDAEQCYPRQFSLHLNPPVFFYRGEDTATTFGQLAMCRQRATRGTAPVPPNAVLCPDKSDTI